MAQLDHAKESVGYMKIWLGVLLVTDISLLNWFVNQIQQPISLLLWGGFFVIVGVTVSIVALHTRIVNTLETIRDL